MTSNSSSIKQSHKQKGSLLLHSCRSYWWLVVTCAVVYGFAGPIFTLLNISDILSPSTSNYPASQTEEMLHQQHLESLAKYLSTEAFIFLYASAVVLAAVIGCVMFFYLQQKKQVNFYHSQPIHRTRLFLNQYITGLIVNVIPLVVMIVVMMLIVMAYGLGGALNMAAILQHGVYLLLLLWASYSIAVLAGQLTGTILTQIALNAVLHFCVPVAAYIMNLLCNTFLSTYNGTFDWLTPALHASPLCAAFVYLDILPYSTDGVMTIIPMSGGMIAAQLAIAVGCSVLSWALYQKRASEATGKALVYKASEPLLKAYLMFVVSLTAGMIFMVIGNRLFFYFAVVSFAILTHMTCEVIIQRDFKAMVKRLPQCGVILVLILAVVGLFRFDVMGYNSYLPAPEKVEKVSLELRDEAFSPDALPLNDNYSQDVQVKEQVYQLLEPIIYGKLYRDAEQDRYISTRDEDTTSIEVSYILTNGKRVSRTYDDVPRSAIEENYAALYNQSAYREADYKAVLALQPEWIREIAVDSQSLAGDRWEGVAIKRENGVIVPLNADNDVPVDKKLYAFASQFLQAYQQDLRERTFETLTQAERYRVELGVPYEEDGRTMWPYCQLTVFTGDKRTVALLDSLQLEPETHYYNYEEALLFRCTQGTVEDIYELYAQKEQQASENNQKLTKDDYLQLFAAGKAVLLGSVEGSEQVAAFAKQMNLMSSQYLFTRMDESQFVLLKRVEGGQEYCSVHQVYAGTSFEPYL